MRYLILGGNGFIGRHLSAELYKHHEVSVIDKDPTPNICSTQIVDDIISCDALEYEIARCDVIFFLASTVGVASVIANPSEAIRNNLQLAHVILPLSTKYNKRIVFTSSSEVYGEGPFNEDTLLHIPPPTQLRWSYAASKLMIEYMVLAANPNNTIVRFFNITGPGHEHSSGMVLPLFIHQAKRHQPIIIHGSGKQVRAFCHVEDAVTMLIKCADHPGVYNIGSDNPQNVSSITDLATTVQKTLGVTDVIYRDLCDVYEANYGDINARVPNMSKTVSAIKYTPRYTLQDILKDML